MTLDLVTGGGGFIGSHLVDRLLSEGRRVRVVDNFAVGNPRNLKQHADNSDLEAIQGEVADAEVMNAAIKGVERVFHLAARADIVPSIQEPEAYFHSNVDGTFVTSASGGREASSTPPLPPATAFLILSDAGDGGTPTAVLRAHQVDGRELGALGTGLRLPALSVRFFNI